jgi:hypothetical protein
LGREFLLSDIMIDSNIWIKSTNHITKSTHQ